MKDYKAALLSTIDSFLTHKEDAKTFEKAFTGIYDFEEPDNGVDGDYQRYFELIRAYLERFSALNKDEQQHPGYFINETELKTKIIEAKEKIFDN